MAFLQSISKHVEGSTREPVEEKQLPSTELDTIQIEPSSRLKAQKHNTNVWKDGVSTPANKDGPTIRTLETSSMSITNDDQGKTGRSRAGKIKLTRQCHSDPVISTRENEFGFDNLGFEPDVDPYSLRFADVVSKLIRDQLKEDLHPFGRGNLYKAALDDKRPSSGHQDDGKLFMWAIASLIILGIVGCLTLRLLFTSIYLPVNSEDPDEIAPVGAVSSASAIFTS